MALRGITPTPIVTAMLSPDSLETNPLVSFETGGVNLNDPSQGRLVKDWTGFLTGHIINVSPVGGSPTTAIVTTTGTITDLSIAFDSNMAVTACWVEDGALKLRWFNTVANAFQIDTFAGAAWGKVSTDDKRPGLESASDVIFAYQRAGVLYYRQERDRYGIEYTVGAVPAGYTLIRMGKNAGNRFQFELST